MAAYDGAGFCRRITCGRADAGWARREVRRPALKIYVKGMRAVFQSDQNEREMIREFLPPRGFFVEVGAYHPSELSQTLHLEENGWDGILVEPVPEYAARLSSRKARVVPVACGSREQHGKCLPIYLDGGHTSMKWRVGPAIMVPTITLDSILDAEGVKSIDFLSIDVEGAEVDVLEGLSERYRPTLILLEDHADNNTKHRVMRKRRYKRVRRTGFNSWYVPDENDFPVSLIGHLQLLRKYYLSMPARWVKRRLRGERPQF